MSSELKCILHLRKIKDTGEELKTFDDETWNTVKNCEKLRRTVWPNSKFNVLKLSDECLPTLCYHSSCYKCYTAVPKTLSESCNNVSKDDNNNDVPKPILRSEVKHPIASSSGVFKNTCLFCNQLRKKVKQKHENLSFTVQQSSAENIKRAAIELNDAVLLAKISDIDLVAKRLKCHPSCRNIYMKRWERSRTAKKKNNGSNVSVHEKAYDIIRQYVQNEVVDSLRPKKLAALYKRYTALNPNSGYKAQNLCDRLIADFKGNLKKCKSSNKDGIVLCSVSIADDYAIRQASIDNDLLKDAAQYLRGIILSQKSESEPKTGESLKQDQICTPDELLRFFRCLYTGSNEDTASDQVERLIKSVSDDVIYATTRGRIKPVKHLNIGLGVKSLTGSRRVVEILNRFGHSVSYHTVEEVETQLASDISEKKQATPDGLFKMSGLLTSLAWDNYDENIETLSGAGTLHDTVGICYQAIPPDPENMDNIRYERETPGSTMSQARGGRRSLEITETSIEPYRKKPRMSRFDFEIHNCEVPENLKQVQKLDMFWMVNVALVEDVPLWSGWNAVTTVDRLPLQKVGYMENLNLPPTRLDVVAETLKRSQKVAEECGEDFVIVTYDLAVAKPALQIQVQESPLYDNVFICFGAFHILMAYFGAVGHILEGSGGPDILTDSGILASGSLVSFMKGKHYNRCKRLHVILASAFNILHFRQFLEVHGSLPDNLLEDMKRLVENPSPAMLADIQASVHYQEFLDTYTKYSVDTLNGHHGSTAKYWLIYIQLVNIFLRFIRASRTNDLGLFTYTIGEMCTLFFATGRPNYSRWMVKYQLNLLNAHPSIKERLQKGALSVRRTTKNFARAEVDLTLEQTINADATSRLTGIAAFSNSDSARQRWMLTRAVRSDIVGNLMEMTGLKPNDDGTKSLKPYRIRKDQDAIKKVIESVENTMNPFVQASDANLYCITTGKQASDDVKHGLLNCLEMGKAWKDEFLAKCKQNPLEFEKPIKRRKIPNFTSDAIKTQLTSKNNKVVELQITRDVFGRLLCISTEGNIDLRKVFSYPLLAVPLSLAHVDGAMNKTDKAKLMQRLEKYCLGPTPTSVDVTLVDAMFLLHSLQSLPRTFGDLSRLLMIMLCKMSQRVDFICDKYVSPSIKYTERERRGEEETVYCISGPEQKLPRDWQNALKNSSFKTSLFHFLSEDWRNKRHADGLKKHEIYLAIKNTCHRYKAEGGTVVHDIITEYNCQHEEADTRLIFHLVKTIKSKPSSQCVVRSNDTDVLVLLLYHVSQLEGQPKVWMDAGLSSRNTRRYIPISSNTIETEIVNALPSIHAFTGNDFCASFMNKGKIRPFETLKKDQAYVSAFAKLGNEFPISTAVENTIERFVCSLYGWPKESDIDAVRYRLFRRVYATKNATDLAAKIRGIDPSSMPPCRRVLHNKIKRANYVASVWKNANTPTPVNSRPEDNGWLLEDNRFRISWFDGDQVPNDVADLVISNINNLTEDVKIMTTSADEPGSDESDDEFELHADT